MILPQDLQHFPHPALIVESDTVRAKFWFAHELELNLLDEISMSRERKSDHETQFVNVDTKSGSGPELLDDDRLLHFVKAVAKKIDALAAEHHAAHIDLIMSAEIMHRVEKQLPKARQTLVNLRAHHDLMHEDILQAIRSLFA